MHYCVFCVTCDCVAVRENRMPGGMPRVKKVRLNSTDQVMDVEAVVEKDADELMLCQVLDARPDIMPLRQGKLH